VPTLVLGNAITSRMDRVLHRIAMSRSKPRQEGVSIRRFLNWKKEVGYQELYHHEAAPRTSGHQAGGRRMLFLIR